MGFCPGKAAYAAHCLRLSCLILYGATARLAVLWPAKVILLQMQGDLNLNIAEAHAFNTTDRFTLDVFVVNGWSNGSVEELEEVLSQRLQVLSTAPRVPRPQHC